MEFTTGLLRCEDCLWWWIELIGLYWLFIDVTWCWVNCGGATFKWDLTCVEWIAAEFVGRCIGISGILVTFCTTWLVFVFISLETLDGYCKHCITLGIGALNSLLYYYNAKLA